MTSIRTGLQLKRSSSASLQWLLPKSGTKHVAIANGSAFSQRWRGLSGIRTWYGETLAARGGARENLAQGLVCPASWVISPKEGRLGRREILDEGRSRRC
jgi:hypothetical protein